MVSLKLQLWANDVSFSAGNRFNGFEINLISHYGYLSWYSTLIREVIVSPWLQSREKKLFSLAFTQSEQHIKYYYFLILLYSQFSSSLPSPQLSVKSHTRSSGTHDPRVEANSCSEQPRTHPGVNTRQKANSGHTEPGSNHIILTAVCPFTKNTLFPPPGKSFCHGMGKTSCRGPALLRRVHFSWILILSACSCRWHVVKGHKCLLWPLHNKVTLLVVCSCIYHGTLIWTKSGYIYI